jgi:hypothetical protein
MSGVAGLFGSRANFQKITGYITDTQEDFFLPVFSHLMPKRPQFEMLFLTKFCRSNNVREILLRHLLSM